ncbi:NAD-binding protein [Ruminococcaceae bacterium OttesenSCG-928-A16]|nr:NAD-binding protein [Ruminococcaceae bacterium OttesenSCG-928-A16]
MNILVVGCHRVGSNLARALDLAGHDVSVLAETEQDLERLSSFLDYEFSGMTFSGVVVDIDILKCAGIENVDAVACVTSDDNINLMVAQIATEMFKIEDVICRVTDPVTKEIFSQRFGLRVVCPTNLTVDAVASSLLEEAAEDTVTFGSNTIGFDLTEAEAALVGHPATNVIPPAGKMLFGLLRANQTMALITAPAPTIAAGDKLVWAEISD